jgi:two-component sensor histidine kinase
MLSDSSWAPVRVDKLAEKIIGAALSADSSGRAARTTIMPSPVEVSPRQAGSLALILNELTTNSIKHGGVPEQPLALSVEVSTDGEFITLCFCDNGPGFPADVIAGMRGNIGQQLIRQLVTESLRGRIDFANDPGAVVRLSIRREESDRT